MSTRSPERKQVSIAEAKSNLPRLVHEVEGGSLVEVTRRGRPVAVIIAATEYERLDRRRHTWSDAYADWLAKYGPADDAFGDPWAGIREESSGRPDFEW